jgi:hypothetical protein
VGAIWITGADLIEFLHEVVGFKMGLAVSEPDLLDGFERTAMDVAGLPTSLRPTGIDQKRSRRRLAPYSDTSVTPMPVATGSYLWCSQ